MHWTGIFFLKFMNEEQKSVYQRFENKCLKAYVHSKSRPMKAWPGEGLG